MIIRQYLPGSERRAAPAVTMSCFIPLIVLLGLAACEESSGVLDAGDAGLMTDVGGSPPPDAATDTSMQDAAGLDVATSDAGTRPSHCAATCSDHGRCVRIDGEPTCACDSGYYPRGLSCLRDPCESEGTCYYVDSAGGNDSNVGTRAAPWRSLGRAQTATDSLTPGDYLLFRRGGTWTGSGAFSIRNIDGAPGSPITIGAYDEGARPTLRGIRVNRASHVTVRDFEQTGSDNGPCTNVTFSGFVILQDLYAHDCQNNGLHIGKGSHHAVLIDNRVEDIPSNDALVVHESSNPTVMEQVGDHFWIVDNVVPGNIEEQGVDVATGGDTWDGADDIKIVGNLLSGGGNGCIAIGHGSSRAWIVGNTMAECTRRETGFSIGLSGTHGMYSGTDYRVVGNIVFQTLMSFVQLAGEAPVTPALWVHHNTFVSATQRRSGIRNRTLSAIEFHHNVMRPGDEKTHIAVESDSDLLAVDHNQYVPNGLPGCRIQRNTLSDWQSASSLDTSSTCEAADWLSDPPQNEVDDVDGWTSAAFLSHFSPDSSWTGCSEGIGAISCDGERHIEFEPFEGYSDNDGYGWEGPLIVRQRYTLRP
jgi:hypothetical protein